MIGPAIPESFANMEPVMNDMILVHRQFVQAVAALAVEDTGPGLMAEAMRLRDAAAVVEGDAQLDKAIARLNYMLQQGDAIMHSKNWSGGNFNANDVRKLIDGIASLRAQPSTPTAARERALECALSELLDEIDNLDCISHSRDLEPYKAEAVWNDAIDRARNALSPSPSQSTPRITVDDAMVERALNVWFSHLDNLSVDPMFFGVVKEDNRKRMRAALLASLPQGKE